MRALDIARILQRYIDILEKRLYGKSTKGRYISWLHMQIGKCRKAIKIMKKLEEQ